jgi:hypothetical protein
MLYDIILNHTILYYIIFYIILYYIKLYHMVPCYIKYVCILYHTRLFPSSHIYIYMYKIKYLISRSTMICIESQGSKMIQVDTGYRCRKTLVPTMLDPLLAGPQVQPFQIFSTWGDYIYIVYIQSTQQMISKLSLRFWISQGKIRLKFKSPSLCCLSPILVV